MDITFLKQNILHVACKNEVNKILLSLQTAAFTE